MVPPSYPSRDMFNVMNRPRLSIWRKRAGVTSTVIGLLFFAVGYFMYQRYISNPLNSHVEERLHHWRALGLIWSVTFWGSGLLFIVSLFGIGWSRWSGVLANVAALFCALAIYGAMCGIYGCT
jgi:hypothetical protein